MGKCNIRVIIVILPQVSPGTHLTTNPDGKDEQLGRLGTDSPGSESNLG